MLAGGFGSLVAEYFADSDTKVKVFAYADKFIEQGGVARAYGRLRSERRRDGRLYT